MKLEITPRTSGAQIFSMLFTLRSAAVSMSACATLALLVCCLFMSSSSAAHAESLAASDDRLLDDIERAAFRFFQEQAHPVTGLDRDRARADGSPSESKASIASSGYSLSAWVIATERGWVTHTEALEQVRKKLRFLVNGADRHKGFYYHFMEMDTGKRAWKCELSSMDSALVFSGAIVAREYFADAEITALVNRMLADVDWNWFLNGGELVALGWHDETGFSRYRWDRYSEHVLMSFLALGISAKPLPASYWRAWSRKPLGRYGDYVYLQEPPLFTHQFPQAYLDLRDKRDAAMDYFRNSQLATLAQRQMSIDLKAEFPLWSENLWGLAASDSATGYKAWGGPPRTLRFNALDGTIVPCAPAGSLPFEPEKTLSVLRHLKSAYGDRIWKRYGFVDAFNPHNGWVNSDVIGIDQGVSMLQAENLRTGLIHRLFMQAAEVKLGMEKAGFVSTKRVLDQVSIAQLRQLANSAWHELQSQSAEPGLLITAALTARQLGLLDDAAATAQVRHSMQAAGPVSLAATARLAAALITARQALPAVAAEASAALERLQWPAPAPHEQLGTTARLAAFLSLGTGARPVTDWTSLERSTQPIADVHVLVPADVAGALLPGLWLDERAIVTGASRSQLAYARLPAAAVAQPTALDFALLLGEFPVETLARCSNASVPLTSLSGDAVAQAALLITIGNLLERDCVREWFGRDPVAKSARAAIAEFQEGAFASERTSVVAQRELAGPVVLPPQREAIAVSAALPVEQWQWQRVAGMEFKDSLADVRPEDPPVEMSFAFAWDAAALHFRAKVIDAPAGFALAHERNRVVEIYIDPPRDGLVWLGAGDYQFAFLRSHHWELKKVAESTEFFHGATVQGKVTPTADGYTVEGAIPWSTLGLQPEAGLQLGVSPALIAEGTKEWEATLKLNWSYTRLDETHYRLGVLTLR